jgi:hypothetical protein
MNVEKASLTSDSLNATREFSRTVPNRWVNPAGLPKFYWTKRLQLSNSCNSATGNLVPFMRDLQKVNWIIASCRLIAMEAKSWPDLRDAFIDERALLSGGQYDFCNCGVKCSSRQYSVWNGS